MKKIVLILIGLSISSFAYGDFEDKHLKCTLVERGGEKISEREAEGLNEYKLDVLVTKTTLELRRKAPAGSDKMTFEFEKIDNGKDIYTKTSTDSYIPKFDAYIVSSYHLDNTYSYELNIYNTNSKYTGSILECKKATLLEKIKYKFSK